MKCMKQQGTELSEFKTKNIPVDWKIVIILPFYKNGHKKHYNNYRNIDETFQESQFEYTK